MLTKFETKSNRVRGLSFHPKRPWILASLHSGKMWFTVGNDYKIRLWNYMMHRCLFTLLGHLDYICTVQFNYEYPWIKKTVSPADDILRLRQMNTDLFSGITAVVKYALEGHDQGVNWASFHPSLPVIVSGADVRQLKLWRFNGHMNKVLCVMFHAKQDIVLSNSDDKSIRVWDVTKRTCVQAFPREHDWFWILASHPEMNLLAADRFLRFYEFSTQKDSQVIPIRRPGTINLNQSPRTLSYSSYELYTIPKDSVSRGDSIQDAKRGVGGSAVFVARNRFANLKNEIVKKSILPIVAQAIFYAGTGNLLCRAEDRVLIFYLQQRLVLVDLQTPFINIALLSKHSIVIASKKLVHRCTLHETIRVKSGAWDDNGVFVYKILNHIKYCLPNGDSGIIKTLDVPIYITEISGNTLFCLDWDWKNRAVIIDATEYVFKLSLLKKKYDQVISFIRNSQLSEGFPEVALHFVKDERTRFYLAIESVNIQITVALENAIDEKDHWYRLGVEALCQGNAGIVEYAYQRTKNFDRLFFLYLVTGNTSKLSKMLKIAELKNDVMECCHLPLAYMTATVHGLNDVAEQLAAKLGDNVPSLPQGKVPSLLMPPSPILCGGDWPLLRIMKGIFEGGLENIGRGVQEEDEEAADADWGKELDIVDGEGTQIGDVGGSGRWGSE
ncbi:hypothetical protein AQUCO_00300222v1 [Aquilegia coerulea]|uniref:Coatomer WD associated region domain-containing protein n=1 Tax=Aquilegia coerulea TaxID=218851 RepID=A0A2G5EXW3_AQUCA|nr:hypothetical protein AQUCO_00300222v1 [Aquilegia coerulea]